jgi:hypothetical protein
MLVMLVMRASSLGAATTSDDTQFDIETIVSAVLQMAKHPQTRASASVCNA